MFSIVRIVLNTMYLFVFRILNVSYLIVFHFKSLFHLNVVLCHVFLLNIVRIVNVVRI